jgi:Fe-S-cluster-containing dehydrogenase component/CRP-like cAMP-binding protein
MPREIKNHEQIIDAFRSIEIVSELVEQLPNGEYRNELEMDIILFGRSYGNNKVGPYVRLLEFAPEEIIIHEKTWESTLFYILVKGRLEATITEGEQQKKVGEVPEGNSFGEMAVLAGTQRNASVGVASGAQTALVLEFTRPALRLLRKLSTFGKTLDRNYRAYGLALTLNDFKNQAPDVLSDDLLRRLGDAARFAVYEKDHVLFHKGDPINRIIFVRHGWIQRASGADYNPQIADLLVSLDGSMGLDLLGGGSCLGLEALEDTADWKYTAVLRGRAEVVEIAVSRVREEKDLREAVISLLKKTSAIEHADEPAPPADKRILSAAGKEIETGVVDSVNLLIMDMAKCIRCGNCSLACHKVHGHSRLIRRGIHIERPYKPNSLTTQSVLLPSVCLHCRDPECLTGCPTGAIARFPNGEIDIQPQTCIGCGDCATQCPYNAISMIPRPDNAAKAGKAGKAAEPKQGGLSKIRAFFSLSPPPLPPPVTQTENLLAVKCNLCQNTGLNPPGAKRAAYSCEENCPTGALVRVNPREYFSEVKNTIGLIYRDKTHAIGKNIHKFDLAATVWHACGTLLALAGGGAALWATYAYTQDAPLYTGTWLSMRWVTGLTGLAGIVWVMAYPYRKQIYRRRAGALRYWMLSHIYIGVLAALVILIHGGTSSGGLLTSFLMISFDLVIASGLFGVACYLIVPRLMTRIEDEPLLLEDLQARREELRAQLERLCEQTDNEDVRFLIQHKMRRRFLGPGYLFRQYFRREDLKTMLAKAREEFHPDAAGLPRNDELRFMEAVENAATMRRIDALCYLHQTLKLWVAPHVLFSSVMLILLAVHIIQVIYFSVR